MEVAMPKSKVEKLIGELVAAKCVFMVYDSDDVQEICKMNHINIEDARRDEFVDRVRQAINHDDWVWEAFLEAVVVAARGVEEEMKEGI
jgi:hypothetical protein